MGDSVKSLAHKKVNYIRNPKGNSLSYLNNQLTFVPSALVWGGGAGIVRRETIATPDGPLPGIVREFTTAASGRIDTITVGFNSAYYGSDTIGHPVKPNTTYTLSFWVKKRVYTGCTVFCRQLNSLGTVANPELALWSSVRTTPSSTWTRVEANLTTSPTTAYIKLMVYQDGAAVDWPVGDNLTVAGMVFEEGSTATPYFDGDTPGYSWSGTPNESITVSDEKEFGDREVRVNAIVNKVRNPDFVGSGSSATGWTNYQSGTVTGTRLFSNNSLTISATSITGNNRRYGVNVALSENNPLNRIFVKKGDRIYARVAVDTSGLAAGTVPYLYFETKRSDGTVISYASTSVVVSGLLTLDLTATADTYINSYYILAISAGSPDWTGTSTVVFSKAMWTHLRAGETPPDWFDGNSPGAQWDGTANNSTSTKSGWRTTSVRSYDGTNWVAG